MHNNSDSFSCKNCHMKTQGLATNDTDFTPILSYFPLFIHPGNACTALPVAEAKPKPLRVVYPQPCYWNCSLNLNSRRKYASNKKKNSMYLFRLLTKNLLFSPQSWTNIDKNKRKFETSPQDGSYTTCSSITSFRALHTWSKIDLKAFPQGLQ